jgi:hypothetical protein
MNPTLIFLIALPVMAISTIAKATEIFSDDFEDGVWEDSWTMLAGGEYTAEATTQHAASGEYSLHLNGGGDHFEGLMAQFVPTQLDYVSFYARTDSARTVRASNYFVLGDSFVTENFGLMFFYTMQDSGRFHVFDGDFTYTFPIETQNWYHIEFRNIDWNDRSWDWYVDNQLVQADIPFRSQETTTVSRLHLYNWYDDDAVISHAWYDEIFLSFDSEAVQWAQKSYELAQNYPNPFNPITTIEYRLAAPGEVTLSVYNINGQLVDVVHDGFQQAGHHTATWAPSDLSSGVYFVELLAGADRDLMKVSYIK